MSWWHLEDKPIALAVNNLLQLLDNSRMKLVEFVLGKHFADKLPQDNPVRVFDSLRRLNVLNELLAGSCVIKKIIT